MKKVYFTSEQTGIVFETAHKMVENEYTHREMLVKGKTLPRPDEYIIVYDDSERVEIVGVLGIINAKNSRLPFQDSFSGVGCEASSVEFVRFVVKRKISIEEKMEIGKMLFEAALNWYVITSNKKNQTIHCYLETQAFVIDFFHQSVGKDNLFLKQETVFTNNNPLSANSNKFIAGCSVYKVNTLAIICQEYPQLAQNAA